MNQSWRGSKLDFIVLKHWFSKSRETANPLVWCRSALDAMQHVPIETWGGVVEIKIA
jgi:hypothetical protein